MRYIVIVILLSVMLTACKCGRSSQGLLTVDVTASPPSSPRAPWTRIMFASSTSGNTAGETHYLWSIDGPQTCKSGLTQRDGATTEFVVPKKCEGSVSVVLVVRRGDSQATVSKVV